MLKTELCVNQAQVSISVAHTLRVREEIWNNRISMRVVPRELHIRPAPEYVKIFRGGPFLCECATYTPCTRTESYTTIPRKEITHALH